jgi:hypothetical protein
MSDGAYTSSFLKFGSLVARRLPIRENASWSHGRKLAIWASLAGISWAVFISVGYFLWTAL